MRRTRRTALVAALALLVAAPLAACSSGDDAAEDEGTVKPADGPDLSAVEFVDATDQAEVEVQVRDNTFRDAYIEVSPGTTITFDNVGRTEHDVYPVEDGAFTAIEPADLPPDAVATLTLDEPGDYAYYCTLHGTTTKGMVGAIRVVG